MLEFALFFVSIILFSFIIRYLNKNKLIKSTILKNLIVSLFCFITLMLLENAFFEISPKEIFRAGFSSVLIFMYLTYHEYKLQKKQ